MNRFWSSAPLLSLLLSFPFATATAVGGKGATDIIFDTDMKGDCDDTGALGMVHALQDRGELNLLGVMVNTAYKYGPACADAINTFYGHPDIPIGRTLEDFGDYEAKYSRQVAENWPHDFPIDDPPDAVTQYRQILAKHADKSITIVSVGFMINLKNLLQTGPDKYSSLSGYELIEQKVAELVQQGSALPSGYSFNFSHDQQGENTRYVLDHWPPSVPVVFSPDDIGADLMSGAEYEFIEPSPVRDAYWYFFDKSFQDRPSWDQSCVLYAARGLDRYWELETTGWNRVTKDGFNEWRQDDDLNHNHLIEKRNPDLVAREIERLMMQPPKRAHIEVHDLDIGKTAEVAFVIERGILTTVWVSGTLHAPIYFRLWRGQPTRIRESFSVEVPIDHNLVGRQFKFTVINELGDVAQVRKVIGY